MHHHTLESPDWQDVASAPAALVLLHGYGSNERDLPSLTPHLPPLPWVSVRGTLDMAAFGAPGGAAWFPLNRPAEPSAEAVASAVAGLVGWLAENVPPGVPLIPVGFSQGGMMALELLRAIPERILATVMFAGLIGETAHESDAALAERNARVFWGRGDADDVIWPAAVERTERWCATYVDAEVRVYPGLGHSVSAQEIADARAFLDSVREPPEPG